MVKYPRPDIFLFENHVLYVHVHNDDGPALGFDIIQRIVCLVGGRTDKTSQLALTGAWRREAASHLLLCQAATIVHEDADDHQTKQCYYEDHSKKILHVSNHIDTFTSLSRNTQRLFQ